MVRVGAAPAAAVVVGLAAAAAGYSVLHQCTVADEPRAARVGGSEATAGVDILCFRAAVLVVFVGALADRPVARLRELVIFEVEACEAPVRIEGRGVGCAGHR